MPRTRRTKIQQPDLTEVFRALSDPVRAEIVRQLADGQSKTCGELIGSRPKSSMSHHFKVLRECGLLETRAEGKEHYNRLRQDEIDAVFPGLLATVLSALGSGALPDRAHRAGLQRSQHRTSK